jgi:rhodanese-related sulfurtransferase
MHRRYYFLIALMFLLALGLVLLPEHTNFKERQALELSQAINNDSRYVSTDQIASRIIRDDPTLLLIDVRDSASYNRFSLEGAVNIPLEQLLAKENETWFKNPASDIVFYSNGDILAEKAWLITFRKGYDNLYIMKGGLNRWAETILLAPKPKESAPREELDLYQFRMAAALYFRGGEVEEAVGSPVQSSTAPEVKPKKTVKVAPSTQSLESEGGC